MLTQILRLVFFVFYVLSKKNPKYWLFKVGTYQINLQRTVHKYENNKKTNTAFFFEACKRFNDQYKKK